MRKALPLLVGAILATAACTPMGTTGLSSPSADRYSLGSEAAGALQLTMLDSVNSLRTAAGVGQVQMSASLNAAAATHSMDMSRQNRPWHFGSDNSSPLDRVKNTGYQGSFIGEVISETYETEFETLASWTSDPATKQVILSPEATDMGIAWHKEPNGKFWWTLVMGSS